MAPQEIFCSIRNFSAAFFCVRDCSCGVSRSVVTKGNERMKRKRNSGKPDPLKAGNTLI